MPTSLMHRSRDGFEQRLFWTVPAACLLGLGLFWLAALFLGHDTPLPAPLPEKPVDAQLIDMPPSGATHARASVPPPSREPLPVQHAAPAPISNSAPASPTPAKTAPTPAAPVAAGDASPSGNTSGARAILSPLPKIPDDLRDEAVGMTVTARFSIAVDGSASVELAQPTLNPRLNRLLLETLRQWRFFPAVAGGRPVASIQEVRIRIQ